MAYIAGKITFSDNRHITVKAAYHISAKGHQNALWRAFEWAKAPRNNVLIDTATGKVWTIYPDLMEYEDGDWDYGHLRQQDYTWDFIWG